MKQREVAIAGVYATRQARSIPDRTSFDITVEAVLGAVADAGLTPADVDGVGVEWPVAGPQYQDSQHWARILGSPLRYTSEGLQDTAGIRGISKAAAAIAAGLCDVVVVGGGIAGPRPPGMVGKPSEFQDPFGAYTVPMFANVAQRHMFEFGTTPEQLATVAATIRNHGSVNPAAVMYGKGPYTVEDVLASRMVASPLHLLDVCLVAQGGAAVVLTTAERARDLPHTPVGFLGVSSEMRQGQWSGLPRYEDLQQVGTDAVARAFGTAGLTPHDVDLFNLYDPTSFEVIRQFEVLGLCAEGEGGAFVEGGTLTAKGACPTNLDGGLLSYTWNNVQQMTLKIVESVIQLRGHAGERQLDDVEVALATNSGSAAQHFEVALLGRI
ncbi:thiolase C-terminal domain-containing protein [Rhodococcus aetherivorans]|uniref:thiolase C-terminal domain-containing protein n=1 Tax=Rhodococcus aetherivorans TaxID=191292 RepID=UPI00163B6175|nr:thiolase family protein [Rhodococcus aetherivorans]MBC2592364.1 thiolase family protein [Rhodococcus aetherivorans]